MAKTLEEMSLEELWRLFPVELAAPDAKYAAQFAKERESLVAILPPCSRISHIGSTAIKGIAAKPITDILVEIKPEYSLTATGEALEKGGYILMSSGERRASFNKGYTPEGYADEVFHLHLRYYGDNDELYFRDYLNENAAAAEEYAALKTELAKRYRYDRDGYTAAKGEFVKKHTEAAKKKYGRRY